MTPNELAATQPKPPSSAVSAPRALLDYDFPSILATPPKHRMMLWLMLGLIAAATAWLSLARVDIIISANGKIISSDSQIVIQPLETSVVRSVAVKPGDRVAAGAVLATLDPTFTSADEAELSAGLNHLQAVSERLNAELGSLAYEPAAPTAEQVLERRIFLQHRAEYAAKKTASERKIGGYRADLAAHQAEAQGLADQIDLVGAKQQIYSNLVEQSLTSKLELLDAQQRLVEAKSRLDTNFGEQKMLEEQIAEESSQWEAFSQEWQSKLSEQQAETASQRDALIARLSKAKLRRELSVLRAPTDAIVLDVADRPAGSVMREAESLMRLVPADAPLIAEVEIEPRDVGRLQVGDEVTLKLEALPWQQFGLARGVTRSISPDVLVDDNPHPTETTANSLELKTGNQENPVHYRVRIDVTDAQFRSPPKGFMLRPGMRVAADIKLGRRSVLEYLINPIARIVNESLREP
jgi:HlyD family secretion protein